MKTSRRGHGCSSGIMPIAGAWLRAAGAPGPRHPGQSAKPGDVPHLAAALQVIGRDVATWEQTDAAWRAVWGGEP